MLTSLYDDLRIRQLQELSTPEAVIANYPATLDVVSCVSTARQKLQHILHCRDDRLIVVVGPCSIHDPQAALEYAQRLKQERQRLAGELELVMRVYFEKPRTTVGWKGLINDPGLDQSFRIDDGLRLARRLLHDINALGVPAGCEFLDMITPQYIADLVAWGAIGARTTESQVHRELASGLSCPVGFKNGTDGNVRIAVDAVLAASQPHHFMAVTKQGRTAVASTAGNEDCHVILRGGKTPNYAAASVAAASEVMAQTGLAPRLMIDASHANSGKKAENQPRVVADIAGQLSAGESRIVGVMLESHLQAGRQDLLPGQPLVYGQSITDACLGWADTMAVLDALAQGVRQRREASTQVYAQASAGA